MNKCLMFTFSALKGALLKTFVLMFLLAVAISKNAFSQQTSGIQKINAYLDSMSNKLSPEKIYVQTDRNFYNIGDTLWFKGYLFEARLFTASQKSGLAYLEVIDNENKIAKRMLLNVSNGLFSGCVPLNGDRLKAGPLLLRAYTNWMRNWTADYFFTKTLYLNINTSPVAKTIQAPARMATNIATANNKAIPEQEISAADLDMQFMPEGGHLVNGLTSTVGFKALNSAGKGVNVSGKIYNDQKQEVARFAGIYAGMGYFQLTPVAHDGYYAVIDADPKGKKYFLPKAEATGIVMQVAGNDSDDNLRLSLTSSGSVQANATYYIVAQCRGVLCYGAKLNFKMSKVDATIPKNKFKTGIVRLSLFDEGMQPVCERAVFVDHKDELTISLKTNPDYKTRDSVSLQLKVTNKSGEPVQGNFSLAVTDNGLVISDTTNNLRASLLLSADLNGTLESPAYYLGNADTHYAALDALMLTQGWVNYKWNNFKVPEIRFQPQLEFTIAGRITNILNKGLPQTKVQLISKRPFLLIDTVSDLKGNFIFKNLPPIDTSNFLLQALNRNGRRKIVNFEIPEDVPAPFSRIKQARGRNINLPADTSIISVVQNNITVKKAADEKLFGKNMLNEVTITDKKIIKGSKNLNGPGNADDVIDEKEMLKAAKTPLIDFLYKRISGFHEEMFPTTTNHLTGGNNKQGAATFTDRNLDVPKYSYLIKRHRVKFVFDGIDAETFFQPANPDENETERWLFLKGLLEQFTAEDIKGMEVLYTGRYNNIYNAKISSTHEQAFFISPVNDLDYAYLEITTVAGRGPFINIKDGLYVYRPLMPSFTKEFYRPRYTAERTGSGFDFRSTLHWESNIVTNENGETTISFFTSDRPGTFTIIAEGSNMNGLLGSGKRTFRVKQP